MGKTEDGAVLRLGGGRRWLRNRNAGRKWRQRNRSAGWRCFSEAIELDFEAVENLETHSGPFRFAVGVVDQGAGGNHLAIGEEGDFGPAARFDEDGDDEHLALSSAAGDAG